MLRSKFRGLLVVCVLMLVWLTVLPAALGGLSSYVTTQGISMAPRFQTGDLAIVRSTQRYHVGDVAAYQSDLLNTVVLHRIVEIDDGRYTFKGDHNSFLDPERPTRDGLIGTLAFRIPKGGVWLARLTSPLALGLCALWLLAGSGTAARTRRRRKKKPMAQHAGRGPRAISKASVPPWAASFAGLAAAVGLVGLVVAVPAWTTSDTSRVTGEQDTAQTMTFRYSTQVPRSAAYDDTTVAAPDPVFLKLARSVDVHYTYRGDPGTVQVDALLSTASGWHSTVSLRPGVPFETSKYSGTVPLDLTALQDRAQAAAAATGIPTDQVDLSVVASVSTDGGDIFEPALSLRLTPLQLSLAGDETSLVVRGPLTAGDDSTVQGPRELVFAGQHVAVETARTLSLILILGALFLAALLGFILRRSAPASEGAGIRRRYAPILVQVQPVSNPSGRSVVDVVDFATLAKLAERYGLLVLHWSRSDVETFVVHDEGITYRYRTAREGADASADLPDAPHLANLSV